MIAHLAAFFRTSLTADPTRDVSLLEEFELERLYLQIEEARFPDRLDVAIDLPEALASARVPALITQPIVENAIRHGVAAMRKRSLIGIAASVVNDGLAIVVSNDVPSKRPNKLSPGFGIGLRNVEERLAARYGDAAHFSTAIVDGRFLATIQLPLPRP